MTIIETTFSVFPHTYTLTTIGADVNVLATMENFRPEFFVFSILPDLFK